MAASPPRSTADLLLDPACIAACKQWIRESQGPRQALIITTPHTGMGVTTLIRLACEEEGVEPVCVSTNAPRLRAFLNDVAASQRTVEGRKKVLIVDPLDAVLSESSGAMDLAEFCKAGSRIPIIFAGMRMRSSVSKLHDFAPTKTYAKTVLAVPPIDATAALAFLRAAAHALGATVPVEQVWSGDVRNALVALALNVDDAAKDVHCDGADAVHRALFDSSLTIRDAIRMCEGDVSMITSGAHENYPLTGQSIETCRAMADAYSLSDVIEEHMYSTQHWELGDVQIAIAAGGPVAYMDKTVARRAMHLDLTKFGTVWSRNNNQRTKEKSMRAIRDACIERGLRGGMHIDSIAALRHMIVQALKTGRVEEILPRLGDLPSDVVLAVMRLWKCGYTQAQHGQLKKKRHV